MVPRLEPTLDLSRQGIRLAEDARDSTKEKPRFSIGWARTECCGVRPPSSLVCENRKWHRNGNMSVCQVPNVFLYVNTQVRPLYSAVPLASLGCDQPRIFPVSFATPFFPSASSSPFPWRGCHLLLPHPVLSVFLVSPFSFALAQNPSWVWVESRRRDSLPTLSKLSDRTCRYRKSRQNFLQELFCKKGFCEWR